MISPMEKFRKTEVYKSIFRHKYDDTPRNRALQIVDNVFLHLHPVRIARHATNIGYTWGMGGITFLLFLVLTLTGVILMFYYRPTAQYAYEDMKYLMNDVPFGPLIRNMHRWAAHAMVITVMLHMFRVFLTGSYKPPRQFNWVIGVVLLLFDFSSQLLRIFTPVGSTFYMGSYCWNEYGESDSASRKRRPVRRAAWHETRRRCSVCPAWRNAGRPANPSSLLRRPLHLSSSYRIDFYGGAFLAH